MSFAPTPAPLPIELLDEIDQTLVDLRVQAHVAGLPRETFLEERIVSALIGLGVSEALARQDLAARLEKVADAVEEMEMILAEIQLLDRAGESDALRAELSSSPEVQP
jgi:hypothetical protein